MKAYVITILGHALSESAADNCIASSEHVKNDFKIEKFEACTPIDVGDVMNEYGLEWNYPWEGQVRDLKSGLTLSAYRTQDPLARMACALSHYMLWQKCQNSNEPILVLEHDAKFMHKLDPQYILDSRYNIVGLNDPIGATRKARLFKERIKKATKPITPIPHIDSFEIPQGLAGNSAYIIKPAGATAVIEAVEEYGLWPNDAIMCRQLVKKMGVTKKFYTMVQGLPSTTTE